MYSVSLTAVCDYYYIAGVTTSIKDMVDPGTEFRGPHGEHGVQTYNWGLGLGAVSQRGPRAEPLVGVMGEAPWSWTLLSRKCPKRGTNLPLIYFFYVVFSNSSETTKEFIFFSFFKIQYTARRVHCVHSKVSLHLLFGNRYSKYELFTQCHTSYTTTVKGPEANSNMVECTIFAWFGGHGAPLVPLDPPLTATDNVHS